MIEFMLFAYQRLIGFNNKKGPIRALFLHSVEDSCWC